MLCTDTLQLCEWWISLYYVRSPTKPTSVSIIKWDFPFFCDPFSFFFPYFLVGCFRQLRDVAFYVIWIRVSFLPTKAATGTQGTDEGYVRFITEVTVRSVWVLSQETKIGFRIHFIAFFHGKIRVSNLLRQDYIPKTALRDRSASQWLHNTSKSRGNQESDKIKREYN